MKQSSQIPFSRRPIALLSSVLLLIFARPATTATIVVTGGCTLSDAIAAANANDDSGGLCPPGGSGADVLEMTADAVLTAEVADRTGLPTITSDITIRGNGLSVERDAGAAAFRLFNVAAGGSLTLEDLTLTGGTFQSGGGGFFEGAGIKNEGELILSNTTVSSNGGNPTVGYGGAIWTSAASTTTLRSSTITGNQAYWGAGIYNFGQLDVFDSTLSYHNAYKYGAALLNRGTATFTNSTLANNQAIEDSGIRNQGDLFLINSTLSDGGAVNNDGFYSASAFIYDSIVWSCKGDPTVDGGNNFSTNGSCGGSLIVPGVDIEEALADNGGPTLTLALLPGSVAADAAGDCGLATDQRGHLRDTACDSGSFELGALPPLALSLSGRCPGAMTVTASGATPDSLVELFLGASEGSSTAPSGLCAGTPLAITLPNSVDTFATDGSGTGSLAINFDAPDCGRVLQAIDTTGCRVSGVELIDSCHPLARANTGEGSHPVTTPPSSVGCAFAEFLSGEPITLTATPTPGWSVTGWTGTDDDASTDTTNSLTMPFGETEVSVDYAQACWPLTLDQTGMGAPLVATPASSAGCPPGEYAPGESILLTAAPDVGWGVGGWSGTDDDGSLDVTNTVTMPAGPNAASVDYVELCYSLTLGHTGSGADPVATPLGDETFWIDHELKTGFDEANSAVAVDLDGDGDLDVIAAAKDAGEVRWWQNAAGDGSVWTEHLLVSNFDGARSPQAADIDGDGDMDIAASTSSSGRHEIVWFENLLGDASSWTERLVATEVRSATLSVADIDGDLDLDIVGGSEGLGFISWWENVAGDGIAWIETTVTTDFNLYTEIVSLDVDGDLDLDIAAATGESDRVFWYENLAGDGSSWQSSVAGLGLNWNRGIAAGDLDSDGDDDLVASAFFDSDVIWLENQGGADSPWTAHDVAPNANNPFGVGVVDLDRDGDLDVLLAKHGTPERINWYENLDGDGLNWNRVTVSEGVTEPRAVTAGDIDGDGDIDVVSAGSSDNGTGGEVVWSENAADGSCPAGQFNFGDQIGLTAAPDPGWEVGSWSGTDDDGSTELDNELTMPAADHTVTVNYIESAPQGPTIALSGSCPGQITIDVTTSDPNVDVILFAGSGPGSTVLPSGGCAGTELDLDRARRIDGVTTDGGGLGQIIRNFGAAWCGRSLQAINRSCAPGNVEQIP